MTEFQINKHHRGRYDGHHWLLEHYEGYDSKNSKHIWKPIGTYLNLISLALDVHNGLIGTQGAKNIQELLIAIESATGEIREALK